ncbi:inositol monophosphatase family protein [Nocardioides sp. GXZ039]|uniref:inositol monophosphatase family protein n=1 Tax=Nocardioides sp. GXZ039 TaxID=3136018 RepID=UPI0030F37679
METDAITTLLQDVAAEVITPRFRALDSDQIDEKNPGDLVTVADREAEVLLTDSLLAAYPDAVVLGEEAFAGDPTLADRFATAAHSFTVDPVDGTKNFVHGSPDHAVMVAELRDGVVVRSWIWQPQHETAYVAELGAGAFCNGERLHVTPPAGPPETWRGATSRRSWVGESLAGGRPLAQSWVCCGVDYPKLVDGAADYLLYGVTMPWDHAPGGLLLTEAGGVLRSPDGSPYDPRTRHRSGLIAAASTEVYDDVAAAWPDL